MVSRGPKANIKQQNKYVNMLAEDSAECYKDSPHMRDGALGGESATLAWVPLSL